MADKQILQQKLDELQDAYSHTKYNKHTNKYLGILRGKMAKVRRALTEKKSKRGTGFGVKKSGDATVVLVGFPNAGKSSLLRRLTGVESKVADYAFTTLDVIPGMLNYSGANIQILDIPGLIEGAHIGKGAGTQVASVIRIADLLIFVLDAGVPGQIDTLVDELSLLDIKVNKKKPHVMIEKKQSGGLLIESNGHKIPDPKEVTAVLNEMGTYNGKIIFYNDIDVDELISLLLNNAVYVNGIIALNKVDLLAATKAEQLGKDLQDRFGMRAIAISASKGTNVEALKGRIFDNLRFIRLYLKPKDGKPDFAKPFVLKTNGTVADLANSLHSKSAKNLKCAYVTGKSVKFSNQKVGGEHILQDRDMVTLVYEKA